MGKRSNFKRMDRDFYPTPYEACVPLFRLIHLVPKLTYYEPCVGRGDLIRHLSEVVSCIGHSDLYKGELDTQLEDARTAQYNSSADLFITNPPWDRDQLHPIIENLSKQKPTWLLFDADWMHTKQSAKLMATHCISIVSVGRVKWFPDSKMTGKDNVCWYHFDPITKDNWTTFYGRHYDVLESV